MYNRPAWAHHPAPMIVSDPSFFIFTDLWIVWSSHRSYCFHLQILCIEFQVLAHTRCSSAVSPACSVRMFTQLLMQNPWSSPWFHLFSCLHYVAILFAQVPRHIWNVTSNHISAPSTLSGPQLPPCWPSWYPCSATLRSPECSFHLWKCKSDHVPPLVNTAASLSPSAFTQLVRCHHGPLAVGQRLSFC